MGRDRYRPIDDRARYWEIFLGGEDELRKFSEEKKRNNVGIRTHAHFFNSPVQLPLAHRDTAEKGLFKPHLYDTAISSRSPNKP